MFQWDAVDISTDSGGQNVLETFEKAIRHNRLTTRTELERVAQVAPLVRASTWQIFAKIFQTNGRVCLGHSRRIFCRWIYFHLR